MTQRQSQGDRQEGPLIKILPETDREIRVIRTISNDSEFPTLESWLNGTRPEGFRLVQVTSRNVMRGMSQLIADTEYTAIWEHEK